MRLRARWTGLATVVASVVASVVAAVATAVVIAAGTADAQVVRGTVAVPGGNARSDGVVLLLLDSASNELSRTLSRSGGSYALRAPASGRYRLLARGIGFHPASTPLFVLHGDTTIAVTLAALPELLPQVTTLERSRCRVRPDSGSAVWTLWEQAKTALIATAITLGDRDKRFRIVLSSRLYGLQPLELRDVAFAETELRGTRPWTSLPPDTLALRGYVLASDSGVTYVAPDLDVLVSRSFVATHCLRVHGESRDDAKLVGIDFAPAPGTRHPEIEGTFWLDAASRELRALEFTYANLPATGAADTLAGGRVAFLRLATGEWIIPDWVIRAPITAQKTASVTRGVVVPQVEDLRRSQRQVAVRIRRGNVLAVLPTGDDRAPALWTRPASTLRVLVTASSNGQPDAPLAGAVVRLPESTRQAVTDSAGSARIGGLVEGDYVVEVTTLAYEALFRAPERLTVAVSREGAVERRVHVASPGEVVEASCGRMREWSGHASGVLAGTVTRDGAREGGAVVRVEYADEQSPSKDVLGTTRIRTEDTGTFTVCGVPRDVPLALRVVTRDGVESTQVVRLAEDQLWASEDLAIGTRATSAPASEGTIAGTVRDSTGTIAGTVRDSTRRAIDLVRERMTTLPAVTIKERERANFVRLEIESRIRAGGGYFTDSTALAKLPGTWAAFEVPGAKVQMRGASAWGVTVSRPRLFGFKSAGGEQRCVPSLYIDDHSDDFQALVDLPKENIAQIEFFTRQATAPIRYTGTGTLRNGNDKGDCGVILVWTKGFVRVAGPR